MPDDIAAVRADAVLLDALHAQGARRERQVLLDPLVRRELVKRSKAVCEVYGAALADGAASVLATAEGLGGAL